MNESPSIFNKFIFSVCILVMKFSRVVSHSLYLYKNGEFYDSFSTVLLRVHSALFTDALISVTTTYRP